MARQLISWNFHQAKFFVYTDLNVKAVEKFRLKVARDKQIAQIWAVPKRMN